MSTPKQNLVPAEAVAGPFEDGASDDQLRLAARLASDYLLRSLLLLQEMGWGDFMTTLVALTIVQTNVGHLNASTESGPPPDPVRRPVSVLALSGASGLSYEATRRHVAKLVAAGVCVRVKGGVIMPAALFSTRDHWAIMEANQANLRRLFRALRGAGVSVMQPCDGSPPTGEAVTQEAADARLRAAIRISSDYVLRSLQVVRALASDDLIEGLVILAIVQANVGHLVNPDATGGRGGAPPDDLRRPVSVMALSANLNIPYETMRRHVAKLLASGVCVRVQGGVIAPGSQLELPQNKAALRENLTNLRRLHRALVAAGVDLD